MINKTQGGQILLIVVLTMIVALTVGLSIAARIVTELKLSKQNEESQRAFQAAESGIQQTLERQVDIAPRILENKASFSTTYEADLGPAIVMNNGQAVDQASGADVWLSDYSTESNLQFNNPMGSGGPVAITLYWGSPSQTSCNTGDGDKIAPAIEVVVLSGSVANPIIQRSVYEATGCNLVPARITTATPGTVPVAADKPKVDGPQFQYKAPLKFNNIDLSNGLIMKVIPIFNSSIVGFSANTPFPKQGSVITSTGASGDTVRKVVYYQSFPQMPLEVFPYSLLSQ